MLLRKVRRLVVLKMMYKRCGFLKKSVSFYIVCFILSIVISIYSIFIVENISYAEDLVYAEELISLANKKKLYEEKYWYTLIHYKKGVYGVESLIDDPGFFLSKDGKYNPQSELEKTIESFFMTDDDVHPLCRFIARYSWLKKRLNIDESKLPVKACKKFNLLIDKIKPKSATLIFPTSSMNKPASMFGHTLLIIETENKSRILSHAVNYAALTDETFGLFFAFKGIFGLYKGYFSVLPYYAKVKEYNDFNQRDIWEYRLNFTEEEVTRMIMHIVELENVYSDYYFFNENCSYNLLFLFDIARPSLNLTDNLGLWVIPGDTVRDVNNSGIVTEVHYRPSIATKVKYFSGLLTEKNQDLVLSIVNRKIEPDAVLNQNINFEEKILICDVVVDYLQFIYSKKKVTKKDYVALFLNVLNIRSKLGNPDENQFKIPVPEYPEKSHKSSRLSIGVGVRGDDYFHEFKYRTSYHDLLDPDDGYVKGLQIQFLNAGFRYYPFDEKIQLNDLDFIDIVSLSVRDKFFKPVSWKIIGGFTWKQIYDEDGQLIFQINPGGGFTYQNRFFGIYYAMMETDVNIGKYSENNYAAGIGGSVGLLKNITSDWKFHLYARDIYYGIGCKHNEFEVVFRQNFRLNINNSIGSKISTKYLFNSYYTSGSLYWNIYF